MKCINLIILLLGILLLGGCKSKDEIILEPVEDSVVESGEQSPEADEYGTVNQEPTEQEEKEQQSIWVYVCGAVRMPGVYELADGSRVYDGIQAAGGLLENAAGEYVNLAKKIQDEEQIYIPTCEEIDDYEEWNVQGFTVENEKDSGLVNINIADEETLCTLPGVGAMRAKAIISYREQNGAFGSIEEIMNVEGIKNGLFAKIESLITVR